jgi:hypothetical protein
MPFGMPFFVAFLLPAVIFQMILVLARSHRIHLMVQKQSHIHFEPKQA